MDTQFFNKFNHYFKDDKVIVHVIQYKKRSKIPANIKNPNQFKNKYKDFIVKKPVILLFLKTIQQKCWKTFIQPTILA